MSETRAVPGSTYACPHVPVSLPSARQYRDLCSTCRHAEACGSRSSPEHPILFCELFEVSGPAAAATEPAASPERAASRQGAVENKGLCANCENLETCTMVRPEGGVWHCEEYR